MGSDQNTNWTYRVAAVKGCGPDVRELYPGCAGKILSRRLVRKKNPAGCVSAAQQTSGNREEWVHRALFRLLDI